MKLSLVIQAGGESRRMGRDKGLVEFLGQTLALRLVSRLGPIADEVILTTNHPERYSLPGVRLVKDRIFGRGALGGLYTALGAAHYALVAVVACDMPFASLSLLMVERDLLVKHGLDAVIPITQAGAEPFHSLYRRRTCLPAVLAAIQADRWRVDAWFDQAKVGYLTPEQVRQIDPQGLAFLNINTPEELAQAEELDCSLDEPC
jgi:molybdopterin-guanine dinucleotide biosynthesis protein A